VAEITIFIERGGAQVILHFDKSQIYFQPPKNIKNKKKYKKNKKDKYSKNFISYDFSSTSSTSTF